MGYVSGQGRRSLWFKGYDLISTGSDQGAIANIDGSTGNAFATNTISRSMYIACKNE